MLCLDYIADHIRLYCSLLDKIVIIILQAAIATLGANSTVPDMDLDEVETTEKKSKKKDKKKRSAAEADTGNDTVRQVVDAACSPLLFGYLQITPLTFQTSFS